MAATSMDQYKDKRGDSRRRILSDHYHYLSVFGNLVVISASRRNEPIEGLRTYKGQNSRVKVRNLLGTRAI